MGFLFRHCVGGAFNDNGSNHMQDIAENIGEVMIEIENLIKNIP